MTSVCRLADLASAMGFLNGFVGHETKEPVPDFEVDQ
jgi:hypothetical protein